MLHVTQLSRRFSSINVVDQVNLSVQRGQVCGLLGPNGAGKSTTIRMICGVLVPTMGRIEIDGIDLAANPTKAKASLGYVPEGAPLPTDLLPSEYLKFIASMYGLTGDSRKKAIGKWADRCDIVDVLRKPISDLSRGYRQRVALVAALMHEPRLLVLDEPSTGLDPAQSASFRKLILEVSETAAVLYSSHHLAEVEATCDVVSIICQGKLILDSNFQELQQSKSEIEIEVSPHTIVQLISCDKIKKLDSDWLRCCVSVGKSTIAETGERIAQTVTSEGGKIRLLQPVSQSLESTYLRLIREAEVHS